MDSFHVRPKVIADLLASMKSGKISGKIAKEIFKEIVDLGKEPDMMT